MHVQIEKIEIFYGQPIFATDNCQITVNSQDRVTELPKKEQKMELDSMAERTHE